MVRATFSLAAAQLSALLGKRFVQRKVNEYKMLLDTQDRGISRSLILFGTREVDHKIILEKVLKPGMRIFDIGANIGYYVLMEKLVIGASGEIIVIEPSPTNISLLKRNLELNGYEGMEVIQGAVSDKEGEFDFFLSKQSNLNTFHEFGSAASTLSGEVVKVRTYTMDELVDKFGAPDLIRMDVEGHEVEIVRGMLDGIRAGKYQPAICFEPHLSCYNEEHDFAPVLKELFDLGYQARYLSSNEKKGSDRISGLGYSSISEVKSDGVVREIFENIDSDDLIKILTDIGGGRTVYLTPS